MEPMSDGVVSAALRSAEQMLAEPLPRRWAHVQGVLARAELAAPLFGSIDSESLCGAAVLHDVGYSRRLATTGLHALDGARFLETQGVF